MDRVFRETMIKDISFTVPERYQNLEYIGSGGQGSCCSAYDIETGQKVCIKKLNGLFDGMENAIILSNAKRAYREIKIMSLVDHQNIIKLLDVFTPQRSLEEFKDIYLVMELMEANLHRANGVINDHDRISYIIYQILCGLNHLKSADLIHRDLKPANIVANSRCRIKILDFGLARRMSAEEDIDTLTGGGMKMTPYVVTRYYRSPEIITLMPYGSSVDVWSVGCIMAELFTKQPLFSGDNEIITLCKIFQILGRPSEEFLSRISDWKRQHAARVLVEKYCGPKRPLEEILPDTIFPSNSLRYPDLTITNARDLLSKMLVIDPEHRISLEEALEHPYIRCMRQEDEINGPPPQPYDSRQEQGITTIEGWKELIFSEVMNFVAQNQ